MSPRESVIAVLVRHADRCLDQADPEVVRDLPAWQRAHALGVAREIATLLLDQLAPDARESADLHDRVRAMEGQP